MADYHRVYDEVTCGLTAKKPGSALSSTLVIEYGSTLLFNHIMALDFKGLTLTVACYRTH